VYYKKKKKKKKKNGVLDHIQIKQYITLCIWNTIKQFNFNIIAYKY